jgi:phage baseplate assembly protein W
MARLITRGFGKNALSAGIISQGHGGTLQYIVTHVEELVSHVYGIARKAVRSTINRITARVTLLAINDNLEDVTGQISVDVNQSSVKAHSSEITVKPVTPRVNVRRHS